MSADESLGEMMEMNKYIGYFDFTINNQTITSFKHDESGNFVYVGFDNNRVYRSDDSAVSFSEFPSSDFYDVCGNTLFIEHVRVSEDGSKVLYGHAEDLSNVYFSTDSGVTFTAYTTILTKNVNYTDNWSMDVNVSRLNSTVINMNSNGTFFYYQRFISRDLTQWYNYQGGGNTYHATGTNVAATNNFFYFIGTRPDYSHWNRYFFMFKVNGNYYKNGFYNLDNFIGQKGPHGYDHTNRLSAAPLYARNNYVMTMDNQGTIRYSQSVNPPSPNNWSVLTCDSRYRFIVSSDSSVIIAYGSGISTKMKKGNPALFTNNLDDFEDISTNLRSSQDTSSGIISNTTSVNLGKNGKYIFLLDDTNSLHNFVSIDFGVTFFYDETVNFDRIPHNSSGDYYDISDNEIFTDQLYPEPQP